MKLSKLIAAIPGLDQVDRWRLKQEMAKPGRYYGHGGTIHHSGQLDVETYQGEVVAIWFRCQLLPFRQVALDRYELLDGQGQVDDKQRAAEMRRAYAAGDPCELTGVEVIDPPR